MDQFLDLDTLEINAISIVFHVGLLPLACPLGSYVGSWLIIIAANQRTQCITYKRPKREAAIMESTGQFSKK